MASWTIRQRADGGTSVQIKSRQEGRRQSSHRTRIRFVVVLVLPALSAVLTVTR